MTTALLLHINPRHVYDTVFFVLWLLGILHGVYLDYCFKHDSHKTDDGKEDDNTSRGSAALPS